MPDRRIFDCNDVVAIAYPTMGRAAQGKVHLMPVPRAGVALQHGVHVEGQRALLELKKAVDHALSVETMHGGAKVLKSATTDEIFDS